MIDCDLIVIDFDLVVIDYDLIVIDFDLIVIDFDLIGGCNTWEKKEVTKAGPGKAAESRYCWLDHH